MKLSLITNQAALAREADACGIDRIMIDLERKGKNLRQHGLDLYLSDHQPEDLPAIKRVLRRASLMVRINPPGASSQEEINQVIESGADYIMLPYFHRVEQVQHFIAEVAGRCRTILLVETSEAVDQIEELSLLPGIDEIHIGLNDLRISRNYNSIFEPLYTGVIEELCGVLKKNGKPYGFGGIGKLSNTLLPVRPSAVLAEQVRMGCSIGWLGRTFREDMDNTTLTAEIEKIRNEISKWQNASEDDFNKNTALLYKEIKAWEEKSLPGKG